MRPVGKEVRAPRLQCDEHVLEDYRALFRRQCTKVAFRCRRALLFLIRRVVASATFPWVPLQRHGRGIRITMLSIEPKKATGMAGDIASSPSSSVLSMPCPQADAFMKLRLPFECKEAGELNRLVFETIYFGACEASMEWARDVAPYETFQGSPASEGKAPFLLWPSMNHR